MIFSSFKFICCDKNRQTDDILKGRGDILKGRGSILKGMGWYFEEEGWYFEGEGCGILKGGGGDFEGEGWGKNFSEGNKPWCYAMTRDKIC